MDDLRLKFPGYEFKETHHEKESVLDGMIYANNELEGLFEIKCRNQSLAEIEKWGSYLITEKKLLEGIELSKKLTAPFYLFVKTIPDQRVFSFAITNAKGAAVIDYEVKETSTRATSNGGWAKRKNAYIPMKHAVVL